ncbi:DUF1799 domain-containing protein [Oceaniglobus trochenteri]|uniref:DUF1799 domain-containing protein n=1 Tax=Oceaniglobus trochenteri TaxID=2763260 RepID=UPI001CFFCF59|nr:DUF1799 domain-containing protein [Oceaniglobus trochenteri]
MARMGKADTRQPAALDEALTSQFAQMGVSFDPSETCPPPQAVFDVWPENWNAVGAFLACQTQWRVSVGMGGGQWLGLDYPAVDVVIRRLDLPPEVFGEIQEMEYAALDAFREQN